MRCTRYAVVALCMLLGVGTSIAATPPPQQRTIAEYRDHLQSLAARIAQCRQHTDPAHCNTDTLGADDRVAAPGLAAPRLVSYAWLRSVFEHAGDAGHPLKPAEAAPLLQAALERLQLEQSQVPGGASPPVPSTTQPAQARTALSGILARAEFRHSDPSLTQRVLQRVALWINRHLAGLAEYSSHRRWLGRVLTWGLVGLACLALGLWFAQQTRRARGLNLSDATALEHALALRHWERWRQDAEEAAQQQRWRDAVRAFYWATIARLESRGQWPADRARTPREYLRLLLPDNPRRHDLRLLTRRFEACWYGAATATQPDCDDARRLFERLATR